MSDDFPSNPFAHLLTPEVATVAASDPSGDLQKLHSQVHLIQTAAPRRRAVQSPTSSAIVKGPRPL